MDYPGQHSDWSTIIQLLRGEDELLVYQGAMNLRDALQYAQENQMHGFMTEQFMDILVNIINREMVSDLGLEVKYFAVQSLTTLMDIFPSLVNNLVNAGLIKGVTAAMQQSAGFIELSEACIKCLEKVVQENPPAVLKSGAIGVVLAQMDYFVMSTQRRIFKILLKIARHSSNENDFDQHLRPVMPIILMNLNEDTIVNDLGKFEDASKIVFEMQESFVLFLSPTHDFKKVGEQYDKLLAEGLFDIILGHIKRYGEVLTRKFALQAKKLGNAQASYDPLLKDLMVDKQESGSGQIDSLMPGSGAEDQIPNSIVQSYLKILENGCRYSINVSNKLFGQTSLIQDVSCFLPCEHSSGGSKHQYNAEDYPFINDAINLLNSVLSDKAEATEEQEPKPAAQEGKEGDGDSIMKGDAKPEEAEKAKEQKNKEKEEKDNAFANLPPHIKRRVLVREFQAKKREFQIKEENKGRIAVIAEIVLPRVFYVYEIMINPQFRIRILQLIDKILALFDDELLQGFIEPKQFANFIYQILRSKHIFSIEVCLRMTKKILDCSPLTYSVPFIREGVSSMIQSLSDEAKFKQFMGIRADVEISDGQFDIEIHSLKEALHYQRINNPDDHHTRDFYERRLLELVDRQRHIQQLEAQEKAEASKAGPLGQKLVKKGPPSKYGVFASYGSYPEKQNVLPKIISLCKQLVNDYFQNKEFLLRLEQHSPANKEQLSIFGKLSEISGKLQTEATKLHLTMEDASQIKELITSMCQLLTQQGPALVTSHEFKDSGLLFSLELLLTSTPSQAKYILEKQKIEKENDGMIKHSDEIMLHELEQKSSGRITQQDGISIMNRLKMCVHLLLHKHKRVSPLEALLEVNHKLISENDSFVTQISGAQIDYTSQGHGFGGLGPPPSFLRDGFSQGDYDHCISALKQLQKRVTVSLIYDPNKTFKDPNVPPPSKDKEKKNPFDHSSSFIRTLLEQEKKGKDEGKDSSSKKSEKSKAKEENNDPDKMSDQENSHMEDMSEVKQSNQSDEQKDKQKDEDKQIKEDPPKEANQEGAAMTDNKDQEEAPSQRDSKLSESIVDDGLVMKKLQTQQLAPSLKKLAGSPSKQEAISEIEKQKINSSKVYLKRHFLYTEVKQIPVTVEQSSCLQILEDFLRNRIRSVEEVKVLKRDYGYGGMHGYKDPWGGAPPDLNSSSPFDQVFGGGQYQSITQKILRKNLGSEARRMLDNANNRLARILNTGSGIKIAQRRRKGKKSKKAPKPEAEEKPMKDENMEKEPAEQEQKKDTAEDPAAQKEDEQEAAKVEADKKEAEKDKEDERAEEAMKAMMEVMEKEKEKLEVDKKDAALEKPKSARSGSSSGDSHLEDDEGSNSDDDDPDHLDDPYDDEDMIEDHEEAEDRDLDDGDPMMDEEDEKHRQLDIFIAELPEEIIKSSIPDEQQHMLVKILTRQHTFMMGYLEMNIQEGGGGPSEEEMYKFEQKLEHYQETMEAVQVRFLGLKEQAANKKKQKQEEKKEHEDEDMMKKVIEESLKEAKESKGGEDYSSTLLEMMANPGEKSKAKKGKDSDQEMADESADKVDSGKDDKKGGEEKQNSEQIADQKKEGEKAEADQKLDEDAGNASHPQVKLTAKENDAEMLKPAEVSDSENIEDSEVPKEKPKEADQAPKEGEPAKADESKDKKMEDEKLVVEGELPKLKGGDRTESEIQLERKREEQELLVRRALQKDEENLRKLKASIEERTREGGAPIQPESSVSEQTQEIINQDLEKLIKEEGEDIEFEFYYEQKQVLLNQTIFEITKNADGSKRGSERAQVHAEQLRVLKEKEEELKSRAREISAIKDEAREKENEERIAQLKKEHDMIKELFNQIQRQYDAEQRAPPSSYYHGGHGPPPGFLSSFSAGHKIFFRIKEKTDDVAGLKRSRMDSLSEMTASDLKRSRTKSEAIQDMSGASIKEFVEQILFKEFKVFEREEGRAEKKKPIGDEINENIDNGKLDEISGKGAADQLKNQIKENMSATDQRKAAEKQEKRVLEQSLRILKVLNFLYTNQDIISERGMKFILQGRESEHRDARQAETDEVDPSLRSSLAPEPQVPMTDLSLQLGFADVRPTLFHNHKLDSYLQRSIKDPYNLVQGISSSMQQIFSNCPYLFPFQTKLLYFKLVSFISAIDVHRSIYFLRQFLRQHSGVNSKMKEHEKDNLKKITRQKVIIQRGKLLQSAFSLIQKIDKRNFLEVSFEGEEGTGLGPTLEFYDNIADEFQTWKVDINDNLKDIKMWRTVNNGDLFPTPICIKTFEQAKIKQIYEMFRLCGTIIAKAIVDDRQIDLPISPLFWKLCLGQQMSIFDYQKLEKVVDGDAINQEKFKVLADFQILYNRAQIIEQEFIEDKIDEAEKKKRLDQLVTSAGMKVDDYFLAFTLPAPYNYVELIPNGASMDVTLESAQDYVDLVLHSTFHESVKIQVQAFKKGFNSIFPISSLQPFVHASSMGDEIEQIVCGQPCQGAEWTNPEELMKHIEPDHGYTKKSEPYQFFIRYIAELEPQQRSSFLKFLTGSKRLPLGGFRSLQPNLTFVKKAHGAEMGEVGDSNLPSCNTCFNYVKCPPYTSYSVFKLKFDFAVQEGQQNFALS